MFAQEVEAAMAQNGCFNIVRLETLLEVHGFDNGNGSIDKQLAGMTRAAIEGIIKQHFEDDIVDELFDLYRKKVVEIYTPLAKLAVNGLLFVMLKHK